VELRVLQVVRGDIGLGAVDGALGDRVVFLRGDPAGGYRNAGRKE
jgi:hypothetical protein